MNKLHINNNMAMNKATGYERAPHTLKKRIRLRRGGEISKQSDESSAVKDSWRTGERDQYRVRRLNPLECCRLQGFPDFWCDDIEIKDPTEEDISFWTDVFEEHRRIISHFKKPKSKQQIEKWLKDPYNDSAEYRMWGNGVALPNVAFVLSGIAWWDSIQGNKE